MILSVLFLRETAGTPLARIGGKARGLARLIAEGLPGPEAFVALPEDTSSQDHGARPQDPPTLLVHSRSRTV